MDEKRVYAKNTQKVMASSANLKALRDQLLLSYEENLNDAEDFMLLYDANIPKGIYLNTRSLDGEQCIVADFRFLKKTFMLFLTYLGLLLELPLPQALCVTI